MGFSLGSWRVVLEGTRGVAEVFWEAYRAIGISGISFVYLDIEFRSYMPL
jgi:hypothetical protein